jgi:hypothetical protein
VLERILGRLILEEKSIKNAIQLASQIYTQTLKKIVDEGSKSVEDISIINNNFNALFKIKRFDRSLQSQLMQGVNVHEAIQDLSSNINELEINTNKDNRKLKFKLSTGMLNNLFIKNDIDNIINAAQKKEYPTIINKFIPTLFEEKSNIDKPNIISVLATGKNINTIFNNRQFDNDNNKFFFSNMLKKNIDKEGSILLDVYSQSSLTVDLPISYSNEMKKLISDHRKSLPEWIEYKSTSNVLIINNIPKNIRLPYRLILSNKYSIEITKTGIHLN